MKQCGVDSEIQNLPENVAVSRGERTLPQNIKLLRPAILDSLARMGRTDGRIRHLFVILVCHSVGTAQQRNMLVGDWLRPIAGVSFEVLIGCGAFCVF